MQSAPSIPVRDLAVEIARAAHSCFAILASLGLLAIIYSGFRDCIDCIGSRCGTPCAKSSSYILLAPIVFTLPYISFLWANKLTILGLVARCAVTSGIGVWLAAMAVIVHLGYLG